MSWLERHVPRHGSKFTFDCIVEGCRMRFSSQVSVQTEENIFKPVKYLCFVSDNSDNWTHRQQLEFAEHRDMILRGTYLFNRRQCRQAGIIIVLRCRPCWSGTSTVISPSPTNRTTPPSPAPGRASRA